MDQKEMDDSVLKILENLVNLLKSGHAQFHEVNFERVLQPTTEDSLGILSYGDTFVRIITIKYKEI